jgi:hypothetical protein
MMSLLLAGLIAAGGSPPATQADVRALHQQLEVIHQDLLRAEATHAAERGQAAAVARRLQNDFSAFNRAVPK